MLLVVLLATSPAGAQGASETEKQVLQASEAWHAAIMSWDEEAIDRIETDDFMTIQRTPQGVAMIGKERQLENLRKARQASEVRRVFERELSSVKVREYGNTAVLTAVAFYRQPGPRRQAPAAAVLITEVWIRDGDKWRLAHAHGTEVPQKGR